VEAALSRQGFDLETGLVRVAFCGVPLSAITPFRTDLQRAQSLREHASGLPATTGEERLLRDDVLRSTWMFAVGAMDAYFCDAYADLVAATLQAKSAEPTVRLPEFVMKVKVPVATILTPYASRTNWRWRMAARAMLADQTSLDLDRIKSWFNPFFKPRPTFFKDVVPVWVTKRGATKRLFGVDPTRYTAADQVRATEAFRGRFELIVQRRHDCIHTCDRPLNAPQRIHSAGTVANVIRDVEFIVENCNTHVDTEFRLWQDSQQLASSGAMRFRGRTV
jgi:hypothetical protein